MNRSERRKRKQICRNLADQRTFSLEFDVQEEGGATIKADYCTQKEGDRNKSPSQRTQDYTNASIAYSFPFTIRNSPGVMPTTFLNTRLNETVCIYPTLLDISCIGSDVSTKYSLAFSIRT